MASSRSVVLAALVANGAIAVLKFIAWVLTQSPSMLSETYHSISDTGNQVFLLIGIRYGKKEADDRHPFGYGKAQFFYSFLVSVLLFGIAGWEAVKHGYHALTHASTHVAKDVSILGAQVAPTTISYTVLIGAFGFETYAFVKARKELKRQMQANDWGGYREAFRKTSDVTTLTAFTEDTIALLGIVLAFFGQAATQFTGNSAWDAVSALGIGVMLMGFALALAWENKRLLLGESMPDPETDRLRQHVETFETAVDVTDLRTVYVGPNRLLVTMDVEFVEDLDTAEMDDRISAIEQSLKEFEPDVRHVYIEPET
jgi:cation diffusion facilitator family transporter